MEYFGLGITSIDDGKAYASYRGTGLRGLLPITSVNAHQARKKKNVPFNVLSPDGQKLLEDLYFGSAKKDMDIGAVILKRARRSLNTKRR